MKIYIVILSLILSSRLLAFTVSSPGPKCSENGTTIMYVNGQENEEEDAEKTRDRIQTIVKSNNLKDFIDKKALVFDYSYNRTFGKNAQGTAIADFLESGALLLRNINPRLTLREAWRIIYWSYFNLSSSLDDPSEYQLVSQSGVFSLIETEQVFEQLYNATVEDTLLLEQATTKALVKNKIIFVSHSQGNLFVNEMYNNLVTKNPSISGKKFVDYDGVIGNLQVATPATDIFIPNHLYVTNSRDAILKVRINLDSNFNIVVPAQDLRADVLDRQKNHGMINTYLNDYKGSIIRGNLPELQQFVFQSLVGVASMLKSNCEELGCGGKEGYKINETAFVAKTATLEEGASLRGNVEICDTSIVRRGATIVSEQSGGIVIRGNSDVKEGTFMNATNGFINIENSTVQGAYTIIRGGADPLQAMINISNSTVYGRLYCEAFMFSSGSCAVNIDGSTLINAEGGVAALGPVKRAVVNVLGSTISGSVMSQALMADSILNVIGMNICSGSSYTAMDGNVYSNVDEVCLGIAPTLP